MNQQRPLLYNLNWRREDPEARWGLPAAKYTGVNLLSAVILGIILTGVFYGALYPIWRSVDIPMVSMFFHGGPENRSTIPYYTVFLSMLCLAFLILKSRKLSVQRKAFSAPVFPEEHDFVLSPDNSAEILRKMETLVTYSDGYVVLARVKKALVNLRNLGRVSDVSAVLNDLAAADEKYIESTYTVPKGIIWAIPVTGFIGTVLGLSDAVGGFGKVISGGANLDVLRDALGGVTGGLSVAFETTLIALVAALIVQLLMTLLIRREEAFLDECAAYCYRNIVSKLKLLDIRDEFIDVNA